MATDIRQLLLAAFDVEHREHVAAIRAALRADAPDWNDVFRRAHSLKGASRAVDLPPVEAVSHRLETLFERVRTGVTALDREATSAVELALDRIESYVAGLEDGAGCDMPGDALDALGRLLGQPGGEPSAAPPAPQSPPAPPAPEPVPAPPPVQATQDPSPVPSPPAAAAKRSGDRAPEGQEPASFLRVPAETVAALQRASADLSTTLAGKASAAEGMGRLAAALHDLQAQAEALESVQAGPGIRALTAGLAGLAREAADHARRQAASLNAVEGAAARVQTETERLALVPAETVLGPLARTIRETAREQGREVDFAVTGLDLPVERATLQALKDPLLHALRNTLSHGWQPPEVRRAEGKPEPLGLALEVALRGGRLRVAVHDDGPGPNLARIEATARDRGLLPLDSAADPETLLRLVFEPGFSTAESIDTLSGRGYGLSVAADAARSLQGSVRLEPRNPTGTTLAFSLPLSAARRSLLLVEAGGHTCALPSSAVERLIRLPRAALSQTLGRTVIPPDGPDGSALPVADLAGMLGASPNPDAARLTAIVLRAEGGRVAIAVDGLSDVRSLLVLPAPEVGGDGDLIAGTAILPGDRPVLVLDPDGLAARAGAAGTLGRAPRSDPDMAPTNRTRRDASATVLVVDDSITTRTLEKGILEAAGYRVVVCVDGQDALDRLRAEIEPVDLVLADVEMPRLDGFGLLKALRADERFARLPTVLMTSRGDPEDVARGLDLGADAYLTKQAFDQRKLLETIGQLL
ncbi:hybrid sensor histidine kinase/response regulator [Methylobacterium persicinum]|uniref:histidine kinase n=1 Tax=Methylobacterium persicinum TaxID=374426 RepID=A0ABU0HLW6_9HYPH|nr:response regulator [Methylobacterium persicinum]MDQ0442813.1 two-component system chemotaxis sensor kinase CheA [Methylobacterium persicinum]GJE36943.1 Sensor histidine kinase RcsC [Methylobacterium persicinum]